jgi:hypothetical protein
VKTLVLAASALSVLTMAQVHAQAMVIDSDGSGGYSMAELASAFPTITDENFRAADTNRNGEISIEELAAAVESGKIPS